MKKTSKLQFLIEGSAMIALAFILSYIKIYKLPNGGSITLGSMVPIIFIGIRHGYSKGILTGVVYGILQIIQEPVIIHPIQVLLDYILAFGALGISGLGYKYLKSKKLDGFKISGIIFISILGRYTFQFISGAIYFKEYAGSQNPWIYSLIYNGSFFIGEVIISMIIGTIIIEKLIKKIKL